MPSWTFVQLARAAAASDSLSLRVAALCQCIVYSSDELGEVHRRQPASTPGTASPVYLLQKREQT